MTEAAIAQRSAKLTIPTMEQIAEAGLAHAEQTSRDGNNLGALQLIHAIAETPDVEVLDSGFDGTVITIKVKSPTMLANRVTIFDGGMIRGSGKIRTVKDEADTYQISINGKNAKAHIEKPLTVHISGEAKSAEQSEPATAEGDLAAEVTTEPVVALTAYEALLATERKRVALLKELKATTSEQIQPENPVVVEMGKPYTINLKQFGLEDGWLGYIQYHQDAAFRPKAISDTQIEITPNEVGMGTFTFQVVQKTGEADGKPVYKYTGVEVRVFVEKAQAVIPPEPEVTFEDWGIPQTDAVDAGVADLQPKIVV